MAKRRKNCEGMIRKRSDGRWEGRVVVGYDEKGLPITKNVLAHTKTDCAEKLEKLKEEYRPPSTRCKPDMPFGDWMEFWYENYSKPAIRPLTQQNYENRIYDHIIPEIGKIPLNKLTQNDLQQFYARLKRNGRKQYVEKYGPGLSDRMVRACHASCRMAIEKAVAEGLIRVNPAIGCKLPPKKAREMQVLTKDELQRFLAQAKEDGYYELFLLELGTGMRRGEALQIYEKALALSSGGKPEYITADKIPDCHIAFLDELFKSNEGVLNSLLKALYDRFDLKVQTEYVSEKANRMAMLRKKQSCAEDTVSATVSLSELEEMQKEVKKIKIPDSINELMDAVLLELRKKDIAVSDRTFFGFGSIVQAQAFLKGRDEVIPEDMLALKNYLWNKPEEISVISDTLKRICENPLGDRIKELTAKAYSVRDVFNAAENKNRALMALKNELLKLYNEALDIKKDFTETDAAASSVDSFIGTLEDISRAAYAETSFTYVSLPELKEYLELQK